MGRRVEAPGLKEKPALCFHLLTIPSSARMDGLPPPHRFFSIIEAELFTLLLMAKRSLSKGSAMRRESELRLNVQEKK